MEIAGYLKSHRRVLLVLCSLVIIVGYTRPVLADGSLFGRTVSHIQVSGNDKTQTRFVLKWANIKIGAQLNQQLIDRARRELLDTELFKQVSISAEADGDQARVLISLKEKRYWLLLPRLRRTSDGDIKTGLRLTMHNIDGADQTLRALIEKTETSSGEDSTRYLIDYQLPQYSRPYEYNIAFGQSTTFTEEADTGFKNVEKQDTFIFSVNRDWHTSLLTRPLTLYAGFGYQQIKLREPYPDNVAGRDEGTFNRIILRLEYDDIHHQKYRRYGRYYSLIYQQGLKSFNSDYESSIVDLVSQFYHRINALDNFNTRLFLGFSHNSPFNEQRYNIGGAGSIRGIETDSFSGDAMLFGNFEYIKGFKKYRSFRTSLFVDVGNVYQDLKSIDVTDLQTSVGIGLRWKAVAFVKTDLFLDLAYNFETENTKLYGGTRLNF